MENKPFGLSYLWLQHWIFFLFLPTGTGSSQSSQSLDVWAHPCLSSEGEHRHRNWGKVQAKRNFFILCTRRSVHEALGVLHNPRTGHCGSEAQE